VAPQPHSHPALRWLNWGIICLALSILLTFLISFIVSAFSVSLRQGIQSLAAAVFPPLSISYVVIFTDIFQARNTRIPAFSLYFISTLWMLILLVMMQELSNGDSPLPFPLVEMLFSLTLAVLIWIYRGLSFRALRACCYGLVSGVLMYLIAF
jgi:hypothetical protein